jgi:hypothetical protein
MSALRQLLDDAAPSGLQRIKKPRPQPSIAFGSEAS